MKKREMNMWNLQQGVSEQTDFLLVLRVREMA